VEQEPDRWDELAAAQLTATQTVIGERLDGLDTRVERGEDQVMVQIREHSREIAQAKAAIARNLADTVLEVSHLRRFLHERDKTNASAPESAPINHARVKKNARMAESARNRAAIFLLQGEVSSLHDKVSSMRRLFDERDDTNASAPESAPINHARVKKNDMWIDVLDIVVLLLSVVCILFFHFMNHLVGQ
jgi:hypothetical protein